MVQLLMVRAPPNTDLPNYDGVFVIGASPAEDRFPDYDGARPAEDRFADYDGASAGGASPKTDVPDYDGASTYGASPAEDRFARLRWCNS